MHYEVILRDGDLFLGRGYGPNYPVYGNCYDMDGNLYYSGALNVRRSGLGWPFVEEPKEFGTVVKTEE